MEKKFKRTTVTSALPYANGPVHIGHLAGVYVPADIYVRYLRLKNYMSYRNTQRLAHFCIFDLIHVAIVKIFPSHTPDKHIVACSGSSVDRPFR